MYKRRSMEVVILWALLAVTCRNVEAGPMKRLSRMAREVYPEIDPENEGNQAQVCIVGDVVYGADEPVPADQPCLNCRCQPPGVQCETLQCEKRPGCKAIHKPNKCCPEYQCECEHDGKVYANGEKLETLPGGECKVCYCRGGEVQCAEVSCYIREDCEGKQVPGQCCPKYDHCPPKDPLPGRPPFTTEIAPSGKEDLELWPITGLPSNATDNILIPTSNDIQDDNNIPDVDRFETTTTINKATEIDDLEKESQTGQLHKITIQEIIPERKEIPVTAPPKPALESQGTLIIEETDEPLNTNSNDLVVTDSDTDSSEISEIFHQPPPVLRIGDKLLFLKKGEFVSENDTTTPNSVITIIGAEGLQRGFEDSGEIHEVKIENVSKTNVYEDNINSDKKNITDDADNTNDLELNTAYSTHILSLVKRKRKPSSTTEASTTTSTEIETLSSTTEGILSETSTVNSVTTPQPTEILQKDTTVAEETTLDILDTLTTDETRTNTEDSTLKVVEISTEANTAQSINPAYPALPEVMTINYDARFDIDHTEKYNTTENVTISHTLKILSDVLGMRSNKTVPQNISNNEWLKKNPNSLINYEAKLPDTLLNEPAPSDFENVTEDFSEISTTTQEIPLTTFEEEIVSTDATVTDSQFEDITADIDLMNTEIATGTTDIPVQSDNPRSVETVEDLNEDSGETTTKKHSHASIVSGENASIENKDSDSSEAEDMVSTKNVAADGSGEETTKSNGDTPGIIDKEWIDSTSNATNENSKDVEIIDTSTMEKKKPVERIDVTTEEIAETSTLPAKVVGKRENSQSDERVIRELYDDLNSEVSKENSTSQEDQKESEAVFRELLEGTSTSKPTKDVVKPRDKETETIQRVSNALTQSLRGRDIDSGILGTLIKFFNSQYSKK